MHAWRATSRDLLIVAAVALVGGLPALILDHPNGHSTTLNLHWAKSFADQFWAGEWYPRWLEASFNGLGAPTFYYYPPVPFWWSSLFTPLFPDELVPLKGLALAMIAATLAAGVGCYLWLYDLTRSRTASCLAASLYVIAPYQLATNFYMRAAYAEYIAAAILPFVLIAARRAALGSRRATLALVAGYAALVMAHLPTALIASIIPAAVPLFFASRRNLLRACLGVWLPMALGMVLASAYFLPALLELELIHSESWWQAIDYRIWFLFGDAELEDRFMLDYVELILVILLGIGVASIAAVVTASKRAGARAVESRAVWFNAAIVCLGAFLATILSAWLWAIVPPLQKIQFPWRALGITELGTAGLLALALRLTARRQSWIWSGWAVAAIALLGWNWTIIEPHMLVPDRIRSELRQHVALGGDASEYTIAPVPLAVTTIRVVDGVASYRDLPRIGKASVARGKANVAVERWHPSQRMVLAIRDSRGARLQLALFHFPIFRAEAQFPDGRAFFLPVRTSGEGLLEMEIPDGERYRIVVNPVPLQSELVGWWLSGIALGVFLLLLLHEWWGDLRHLPSTGRARAAGAG